MGNSCWGREVDIRVVVAVERAARREREERGLRPFEGRTRRKRRRRTRVDVMVCADWKVALVVSQPSSSIESATCLTPKSSPQTYVPYDDN